MNRLSDQLPIFNNIFEAQDYIINLENNADKIPGLMPFPGFGMDFYTNAGCNLDIDDFIITRLSCNPDDIDYYRMLSLDSETEYLTDFKRYSLKPNLYNRKFLFRGQTHDYASIKANLFRYKKKKYFLDTMIKNNELAAFIAMHPLVQLLGIKGFDLHRKSIKFQANLYGLAQHYYNRTTQVDFSSSFTVASFFAVTTYDQDSDRYLPVDVNKEPIGVIYVLPFTSALSYNRMYGFDITSIGKQYCFKRSEKQLGFLVDASGGKDVHDHPLLLKFKFRQNQEAVNYIYNHWDKGRTIAPSDPLELYWRKYRDIKGQPFDISDKAIELNLYMNPKETRESIIRKISQYENEDGNPMFRLTRKTWPEFPRELLEGYWQDIKNGWWQDEFCSNIYFVDLNHNRYMEALKNLPSDSRYQKYFKE